MELKPPVPGLEFIMQAVVDIGPPGHVSRVSGGQRRYIPILGGSFTGERLSGEVLHGGADWQIIRPDGSALLHAEYTLKTDGGALIYVDNTGVRWGPPEVLDRLAKGEPVDPAEYYFRTTPRFETGAESCAWLNNIVAVCSAVRKTDQVIIDFYEVT